MFADNGTDTDGDDDQQSDLGAELSTQITLLPNGPTDSPSAIDTDDQGDDDQQSGPGMVDDQGNAFGSLAESSSGDGGSTAVATPGTMNWLTPGSEDSPLFRRQRQQHWLVQRSARVRPTLQ